MIKNNSEEEFTFYTCNENYPETEEIGNLIIPLSLPLFIYIIRKKQT